MSSQQPTIIYTLTDEAPLLATSAFLPIIRTFAAPAGINVATSDISVAGRVLAAFSDYLTEDQRREVSLALYRRVHGLSFVIQRTNFEIFKFIDQKLKKVILDNKQCFQPQKLRAEANGPLRDLRSVRFARRMSQKENQSSNIFLT